MSREDLAHTGLIILQEAMSAAHIPGAAALGRAVTKAVERRKTAAIEVLIDELQKGASDGVVFGEDEADEFAQMLLRFIKATETGAAKENLRLLAQVMVGLKKNRALNFDSFQRWANILETLTRDEILLLGFACQLDQIARKNAFWSNLKHACSGTFTVEQMWTIGCSLTRTGAIVIDSEFAGVTLTATPLLQELASLARLQDIKY